MHLTEKCLSNNLLQFCNLEKRYKESSQCGLQEAKLSICIRISKGECRTIADTEWPPRMGNIFSKFQPIQFEHE